MAKARDLRGGRPDRKPPARGRNVPPKAKAVPPAVPLTGSVDDLLDAALRTVKPAGDEAATERARRREAANAVVDERLLAQLKRAVAALLDRKAEKLVVLNLTGLTTMSDYFVLATATNDRQAQALADAVEEGMKAEGRRPLSVEGYQTAAWILLDYGDVVFHVLQEGARRFYGLERLWGDAPDATDEFREEARPRRPAPET